MAKCFHEFVWKRDSIHKFTIGCNPDGAVLGDRFASKEKREVDYRELSVDPNWSYQGIKEDRNG